MTSRALTVLALALAWAAAVAWFYWMLTGRAL